MKEEINLSKEFNVNDFIEKYKKEEQERLKRIAKSLAENPMCESCSQYFPGCCACENI